MNVAVGLQTVAWCGGKTQDAAAALAAEAVALMHACNLRTVYCFGWIGDTTHQDAAAELAWLDVQARLLAMHKQRSVCCFDWSACAVPRGVSVALKPVTWLP